MAAALAYARRGAARGEVPVGAVIVDGRSGVILAHRHNLVEAHKDPTAHAELLAIRAAGGRSSKSPQSSATGGM